MACARRSWSDIPLKLAGLVLHRLPAPVDRVRFAAVCPQWRAALRRYPLPSPLPLLAVKNGTFYSLLLSEPLCFDGYATGFATACDNWLVFSHWNCCLLVDPFSGATMTLPAVSEVRIRQESDDSGSEGDDSDSADDSVNKAWIAFMDDDDRKNFDVIKLIVCSPHLIAALFSSNDNNRIAVCQPGASLWSVAWDLSLWITDMAFYQGKLYAVDYEENLLALDISVDDNTGDPRVARIGRVIKGDCRRKGIIDDFLSMKRMLYLVESRGSLLMVRRKIFHRYIHGEGQVRTFAGLCEPELVAFEADFRRSRWAELTALGDDQALFLGPCSRAVCMPQCDMPGSRVWFLDDYKNYYNWDEEKRSSISGTSDMANNESSASFPLPMISWRGYMGCAGAAWLFPLD